MNMWLITWEGTGDLVADENKIACVLSSRYSDSYVEKIVDILYQRTIFDVHEMAYYANKKEARLKRTKTSISSPGRIFYGSNPWLYGRKVKDFRLSYDSKDNLEIISWVEIAIFGNDPNNNYKVTEMEPEKKMRAVRTRYRPIESGPQNA